MKPQFRLYRRSNGGRFYLHNNTTGKQESLGTTDRSEAARLLHARNEASRQPLLNVQIARAYLAANDTEVATRNWQDVMNDIFKSKQGSTLAFYVRAFKQKAFDSIRKLPIGQTHPEHYLHVLGAGTVATNKNLRR